MASLTEVARDRKACKLAFDYLSNVDERATSELISHYLSTPSLPDNMQKVLRRLIESAKNYGRMQNLIGNITDLQKVLCDYDPSAIIQRYHGNSQELLKCIIIEKAKTERPILVTKPNILWSRYCRLTMRPFLRQSPA